MGLLGQCLPLARDAFGGVEVVDAEHVYGSESVMEAYADCPSCCSAFRQPA